MMKGFSISAGDGSQATAWARKLLLPAIAGVLVAVLLYMNQELVSTGVSQTVAAVRSLTGEPAGPASAAAPAPAPVTPPAVAAHAQPADSTVAQAGTATVAQGKAGVPGAAAKAAATKAANAASDRVRAQTEEGAAPPAAKAAPAAAGRAAAASPASPASAAVTDPAIEAAAMIYREVFTYEGQGRRDPFVSLMRTTDLRPALQDLRLTGILFDHTGERPVAIMRETTTNEQYRVTTGMTLGRMRVAEIHPKKVIFIIEEFGFSRRDSLVLADPTTQRIQ